MPRNAPDDGVERTPAAYRHPPHTQTPLEDDRPFLAAKPRATGTLPHDQDNSRLPV